LGERAGTEVAARIPFIIKLPSKNLKPSRPAFGWIAAAQLPLPSLY
jgi:hypothetical protein